ncbi:hypothetical protein NN561_020369 [Cricetulus griseus]
MFYSGLLTEGGRKETDMREAASLRQQRRMKQAVQFIHKDSADLLPLDGLKKLGSSKDTVSSPPRPLLPPAFLRPPLSPKPSLPLSLSHCPLPGGCSAETLPISHPWGPRSFPHSFSLVAAYSREPGFLLPRTRKKDTLPGPIALRFPLLRYSDLEFGSRGWNLTAKSQLPLPPRRLHGQSRVPDRGDS